jgi:AcrR family transcriptional regulator
LAARANAQHNRERLLRAAAEVFAERGVSAPMSTIAHRAGFTKMTLYRHFASKDELLAAIMADHFDRLRVIADELADSPMPARDAVETYMERAALQLAPDHAYFLVLHMAGLESDALSTSASRLDEAIGRLLKRAQAEGTIRGDLVAGDLHQLALAVTSSFAPGANTRPMIWQRYLALLLDGLRPSPKVIEEPPMELEEYRRHEAAARRRRAGAVRARD